MLQPGKSWFGRRRPSRPTRARIARSANRLSEDRRLETNKNEQFNRPRSSSRPSSSRNQSWHLRYADKN